MKKKFKLILRIIPVCVLIVALLCIDASKAKYTNEITFNKMTFSTEGIRTITFDTNGGVFPATADITYNGIKHRNANGEYEGVTFEQQYGINGGKFEYFPQLHLTTANENDNFQTLRTDNGFVSDFKEDTSRIVPQKTGYKFLGWALTPTVTLDSELLTFNNRINFTHLASVSTNTAINKRLFTNIEDLDGYDTVIVKDANGNPVLDENGEVVTEVVHSHTDAFAATFTPTKQNERLYAIYKPLTNRTIDVSPQNIKFGDAYLSSVGTQQGSDSTYFADINKPNAQYSFSNFNIGSYWQRYFADLNTPVNIYPEGSARDSAAFQSMFFEFDLTIPAASAKALEDLKAKVSNTTIFMIGFSYNTTGQHAQNVIGERIRWNLTPFIKYLQTGTNHIILSMKHAASNSNSNINFPTTSNFTGYSATNGFQIIFEDTSFGNSDYLVTGCSLSNLEITDYGNWLEKVGNAVDASVTGGEAEIITKTKTNVNTMMIYTDGKVYRPGNDLITPVAVE